MTSAKCSEATWSDPSPDGNSSSVWVYDVFAGEANWSQTKGAIALRETQSISGNTIKPPISAAVTGAGNSSVSQHAFRVPKTHTFSRNLASGRATGSNATEIGGRIRTFLASTPNRIASIAT